jgi:hypothetical protein
MISSFRASHGVIANSPATLAVHASAPILTQRTFQGSGAPSNSTLITGNGRYCAGNGGWVIDGAIFAPGVGFVVGDVLTVGGGTHTTATQFKVDMVSATGGVLDFHCVTVGVYTAYPNAVVSATGGTGSGAEFNLAQQPADMYLDYTGKVLYICTAPGSYNVGAAGGSAWAVLSGFPWQTPYKELDPRYAVAQGTFVYISPLSALVTAGMTDLISNATVISCEGIWQAAQNVPAAAGGKYNVPVFPYIAGQTPLGLTTFLPGTTAPSGTPLVGDLDLVGPVTNQPSIFWIYWGQVAC